jgi:hypothetical protein
MSGAGRLLAGAYAVFALAAGARSLVQLATHGHRAPLAYGLSALAALTYLAATLALRRGVWRVAAAIAAFELTGVVVVGTLSLFDRSAFPDETVWSDFGSGYGWVPLALPVLALTWLVPLKSE